MFLSHGKANSEPGYEALDMADTSGFQLPADAAPRANQSFLRALEKPLDPGRASEPIRSTSLCAEQDYPLLVRRSVRGQMIETVLARSCHQPKTGRSRRRWPTGRLRFMSPTSTEARVIWRSKKRFGKRGAGLFRNISWMHGGETVSMAPGGARRGPVMAGNCWLCGKWCRPDSA
jgi:hypothetical protein